MIIKEINILSFGKLKNKKISFSDNFNVIYGRNESGKSTIASFIEAMLYSYPPRSERDKYIPWDNSPAAGFMSIKEKNENITIYRKFGQSPKYDVTEITPPFQLENFIPQSRETYRKSAYSQEGHAKDFGTNSEIEMKISNIISSGDENISVTNAIEKLEKIRRTIKPRRGNSGEFYEIENKITLLENELVASRKYAHYSESIKNSIAAKEAQIHSLEKMLDRIEKSRLEYDSSSMDKINSEIKLQEEYIAQFPSTDIPIPDGPKFISPSIYIYILCTIAMLIIGFVFFLPIAFLSVLPIFVYLALFYTKIYKFKAAEKAFLTSVQCASLEEYESMLSDKEDALDYYNTLLKNKSALVEPAAHDAKLKEESTNIYKKILALKNEISRLEKEVLQYNYRSSALIEEDLSYYKNLKESLTKKLLAIDSAIDAFNHAKECISKDFTPLITQKAMSYLNKIAPKDGRTADLSTDFQLSITDTIKHDLSSHSFGFREELYLCFRIALSDVLYGKNFPLILDNPFVFSDDYREKALIDLLYSLSEERQIIIFTNRQNSYFSQLNCNWVDIEPQIDV